MSSAVQRVREIRSMAQEAGLLLSEPVLNGSGHYRAQATAEDGTVRTFHFSSTASCPRTSLNDLAMLRRFARAHKAPQPEKTAMGEAISTALLRQHTIGLPVISGRMTLTRKGLDLLQAQLTQPAEPAPQEPKTMEPVQPPSPPIKRKTVLSFTQKMKLVDWLKANASLVAGAASTEDRETIAKLAAEAINCAVTVRNLDGVFEAAGLSWPARHAAEGQLPLLLLVEIARIEQHIGLQLPSELYALLPERQP